MRSSFLTVPLIAVCCTGRRRIFLDILDVLVCGSLRSQESTRVFCETVASVWLSRLRKCQLTSTQTSQPNVTETSWWRSPQCGVSKCVHSMYTTCKSPTMQCFTINRCAHVKYATLHRSVIVQIHDYKLFFPLSTLLCRGQWLMGWFWTHPWASLSVDNRKKQTQLAWSWGFNGGERLDCESPVLRWRHH